MAFDCWALVCENINDGPYLNNLVETRVMISVDLNLIYQQSSVDKDVGCYESDSLNENIELKAVCEF